MRALLCGIGSLRLAMTFDDGNSESPDLKLIKLSLLISFAIVNPAILLLHGYYWVTEWESQAFLVYALKLSPLLYLAASLFTIGRPGIKALFSTTFAKIASAIMFLGLATPWVLGSQPSLFYYVGDMVGIAVTFGYFAVTAYLLNGPNADDLRTAIFRHIIVGAAVTSLVIVLIYIWSGGEKVSLPPDIHYGLALGVVLYLTSDFARLHLQKTAYLLAAGVGAAQFRMNLLIFVAGIVAAWVFTIKVRKKSALLRLVATSLLVMTAILPFSESVNKTMDRLSLVTWSPMEAFSLIRRNAPILGSQRDAALKRGQAVDQRYVEAVMVLEEMNRRPVSFLTGYGFGATFDNSLSTLAGHPVKEHSVHNSIFAIMLRNGIIGVGLFLLPAFYAVYSVFRMQDRSTFAATVGLLAIYLACMTDQYVYWGSYLGIAVAMVWGAPFRRVGMIRTHEETDPGYVPNQSRSNI